MRRLPALCEPVQVGRNYRSQLSARSAALRRNDWLTMKSASIPRLLLENSEAFIEKVVPHELAHLLVWKHFRARSTTWQKVEVDDGKHCWCSRQ